MRDYAELVKALRYCSDISDFRGCLECVYEHKCREHSRDRACINQPLVMVDAADAIEELLGQHEADAKEIEWLKKCVQDLPKPPRWISVEYELPSRYETVLLNIQTCKDSYVTIGDYEPNELRFRDFSDRNNQVYCGDIVTHWMPLPEPPKEVE